MSVSSTPPLPRQPIGVTFLVAISLLGIFAIFQILAVVFHFAPIVRQQIRESASAATDAAAGEPALREAAPTAPVSQPRIDQEAARLINEADRLSRIGQIDEALAALDQLSDLLPGDPGVSLRRAQFLEELNRPAEAVVALEEALKYPGLPGDIRRQAEQRLRTLAEAIGSTGALADRPPARSTAVDAQTGSSLRDDVGLQPGSVLGIIHTATRNDKPGSQILRIAVKSRPGESINVADVKLHVFFYEEVGGEVVLTESKVVPQWLSNPIDWSANEPELLDVEYLLPDSAPDESGEVRKYHGYVIGVYYNNELQDSRADPGRLDKQFPLPLYLK